MLTETVHNAAGATAWIGLYKVTDPDYVPGNAVFLNGTLTPPNSAVTDATLTFTAPTAGPYEFRLYADNIGFLKIATSPTITVQVTATPSPAQPAPTPPQQAPTPTQTASVPTTTSGTARLILSDNFESGVTGNWDPVGTVSVVTDNPHSGRYSLATNSKIAKYPKYRSTRGYLSFWNRFQPGHNFFVNTGPGDTRGPNPWTSHWFRVYLDNWNYDIDTALAKTASGATQLYMNIYGRNGSYPVAQQGSQMQLADGLWHHVEEYFQANTQGHQDGFITVWLDGQVVYQKQNFEMTPGFTATMIDTVEVQSNISQDPARAFQTWVDDIELWDNCPASTMYSGLPSCAR